MAAEPLQERHADTADRPSDAAIAAWLSNRRPVDLATDLGLRRRGRGEVILAEPTEMQRLGIVDSATAISTALDIRAWFLARVWQAQPPGLDLYDSQTRLEYTYVDGFMRFPDRRRDDRLVAKGPRPSDDGTVGGCGPPSEQSAGNSDGFRYFFVIGIRDSVVAHLGPAISEIPADLCFDRFEITSRGARVTPLLLRSERMRPRGRA